MCSEEVLPSTDARIAVFQRLSIFMSQGAMRCLEGKITDEVTASHLLGYLLVAITKLDKNKHIIYIPYTVRKKTENSSISFILSYTFL